MALTIPQIVGQIMAEGGEELSVRAIQKLCFHPCYTCRKDVDPCLPPSIGFRTGDGFRRF